LAAALGDRFAVGDHVELSDLAGLKDGFHAEALFDQGHETRDLGLVVVSRGAVDDFDLHLPFVHGAMWLVVFEVRKSLLQCGNFLASACGTRCERSP